VPAKPAAHKPAKKPAAKKPAAKPAAKAKAKAKAKPPAAPKIPLLPPDALGKRYWLMKSEPDVFSIQMLEKVPGQTTTWEGVRNYQARNFMRAMQVGDGVVFYHSNAEPPGAAGLAEIVKAAYPDPAALDPKSDYYDPKCTAENNLWSTVELKWVATFPAVVSLDALRADPALAQMRLLMPGNRLSVTPVSPAEFAHLTQLGKAGA
jgi:predicted RNA-binding protein with PUA-like domain